MKYHYISKTMALKSTVNTNIDKDVKQLETILIVSRNVKMAQPGKQFGSYQVKYTIIL